MAKTTDQLIQIINSGSGIIISAKNKTTEQLIQLANSASKQKVHIYITDSNSKTTDQLIQIGKAGAGYVVLDFRE